MSPDAVAEPENPWEAENPHAGKSAVVLDIGDGVGALIVVMPEGSVGLEVEIVPEGTRAAPTEHSHADHPHGDQPHADHSHGDHPHADHSHADHPHGDHSHGDHSHGDSHHHDDDHDHDHPGAPPHVAVVLRPTPGGQRIPSLVFPSLAEGSYDLYVRPDGPVRLTALIRSGEVTQAVWPAG